MQQTFEGSLLQNEIIARGYAEVQHGIHDDAVQEVVERYTDFTLAFPNPDFETMNAMLPNGTDPDVIGKQLDQLDYSKDTQAQWHKYRTSAVSIGKPDGYTNRTLQAQALASIRGVLLPNEDPKEFYHHTPRHYANMARQHKLLNWGPIPPEVAILDKAFSHIHTQARKVVTSICAQLEPTHPGINNIVTKESLFTSPLRLLFYHPSTYTQLAAPHFDKSVLTIQIGESHRGLRIATQANQQLAPVVRKSSMGVAFASSIFSAQPSAKNPHGGHFPDSDLRPAWHDVIADHIANEGRLVPARTAEVCARWALIFFANEHAYVDPGKTAMHSRN